MKGFLLDENLPDRLRFKLSELVVHSREIGERVSDNALRNYAREHDLVIVSKDADFSTAF